MVYVRLTVDNLNIQGVDTVIRTKRRSISLSISLDGHVTARVPLHMPLELVERLIQQKSHWITHQKSRMLARPKSKPKQFEEHEQFLFLGQSYPLKISSDISHAVVLEHGFLKVADVVKNRRDQVLVWYQIQAKNHITSRVDDLAKNFGIAYKSIKIRDARTRWGSCVTGGLLNFTWRLIMAPAAVVDYVIIHELAHVRHMNHSARFWREVGQMMPDYMDHERWLKENGRLLII